MKKIAMSTKKVTINIDEEVWEKYIKKIEEKEGTTYGKLGKTISELIQTYYLNDEITMDNTELTQEIIQIKESIKKLKKENKRIDDEIFSLKISDENIIHKIKDNTIDIDKLRKEYGN